MHLYTFRWACSPANEPGAKRNESLRVPCQKQTAGMTGGGMCVTLAAHPGRPLIHKCHKHLRFFQSARSKSFGCVDAAPPPVKPLKPFPALPPASESLGPRTPNIMESFGFPFHPPATGFFLKTAGDDSRRPGSGAL